MRPIFLILLLAVVGPACGSDADCSIDKDCFQGESCLDGLCIEGLTSNNTAANNTAANNTTANNTPVNNTATNNTAANNTASNNTEDLYAELKSLYPTSACIVDVFSAECSEPDDNGSFPDYLESENGAGGCLRDDTANPIDFTNTLEMCATELKDRYQTNLRPCDSLDFILTVVVTPKIKCDPALFNVNLTLIGSGRSCADNDPTFKCEFLADGTWRAQVVVKPGDSILSATVDVEAAYENMIDFEYDLRFSTGG